MGDRRHRGRRGLAFTLAWWQTREARAARAQTRALADEVAQPYVVVFMNPDPMSPENIHLVVRNLGQTAALDVRFTTDPELRSALYEGLKQEVIRLPESIPVVSPGQEWHTFWDAGRETSLILTRAGPAAMGRPTNNHLSTSNH